MAAKTRAASRPLGALISQGIVAAASLGLQLVAFAQLGARGLGSFSLLFGILVTVNSMQSGWIGDSLTVLDRFEPGFRRALIQSQVAAVGLTFLVTTLASLPIGGIDLIRDADRALYQVKSEGRNRFVLSTNDEEAEQGVDTELVIGPDPTVADRAG